MLYSFHYNTFIFWQEIIALLTSKQWMILDNSLKSFEKKRKKGKKTVIGVSYKMAAKMGNYPISFWHSHFFSYILFSRSFTFYYFPDTSKSHLSEIFSEKYFFSVYPESLSIKLFLLKSRSIKGGKKKEIRCHFRVKLFHFVREKHS